LSKVALEACEVAKAAAHVSLWRSKPIIWVRVSVGVATAILVFLVLAALSVINLDLGGSKFSETAQGVEAAVNSLVFVAIAIYSLLGIETRLKRARALKQLRVDNLKGMGLEMVMG
jgi:hypothetical protein